MMGNLAWVGLGGLLGSMARYLCVWGVGRLFPAVQFPYGTLFVNIVGCFVIGFIGGLAANKQLLTEDGRVFLFTGILGGFTTYSAFGMETFYFLRTAQWNLALMNIFLQLVLGIGAVAVGFWLSELV